MIIERKHILNIESEMNLIEGIFSKYFKLPDNVWFIKGQRDPIESRSKIEKYIGSGIAKNKPWHPFLSVNFLSDIVEYYQYYHIEYIEEFKENPLIPNSKPVYNITPDMTYEEIVEGYLCNCEEEDMKMLYEYVAELYYHKLRPIFKEYPNNIFRLDTKTNLYILNQYPDVRIYRYEEKMDQILVLKELEDVP